MKPIPLLIFVLSLLLMQCQPADHATKYRCHPCNLQCDEITFDAPGYCPHCGMALFRESDAILKQSGLQSGKGFFLAETNKGQRIAVFYYRPDTYHPEAPVLMAIPGSGRSAESYRNAWMEAADRYGLLVLSPLFPERHYNFEAYHLGGLSKDAGLKDIVTYEKGSNAAWLEESQIGIKFEHDRSRWLFRQLDNIFITAAQKAGSNRKGYDLFGHSAGGHIAHRLSLFADSTLVERIVAANTSFYTIPNWQFSFPFGLQGTTMDTSKLRSAFQRDFCLLLGELDNASENRGILLRSSSADRQGLHRLDRGQYFYQQARQQALLLRSDFKWNLQIVSGTGHDQKAMAQAAAGYLYEAKGPTD